jgi:transposase-like protein
MRKTRRKFSPLQKAEVVRRHLADKVPVSNLADELGLQPSRIHSWVQHALSRVEESFAPGKKGGRGPDEKDQKIANLEAKVAKQELQLAKKNEVVAELMQEHVQLKKEFGEL